MIALANFTRATSRKFFVLLLAFPFYLFSSTSFGAVIFQDNFDNNCSGQACNASGGWSYAPDGWEGWGQDGGTSATYNSATHYSGEVSSPGRESGKSLKLWRHSNSWGGYTGSLVKYFSGSHSDFYMRFYAKLPTSLDFNASYLKLWRFNISGDNEFYLNINHPNSGWYRGNAELQLLSGGSGWVTLLNASQLLSLWDGQWHAWQFRFNLATKTVTFWADGTQISQVTLTGMPTGSTFGSQIQHFPLGNSDNGYWQSSWQAFEVDDLVIATTKAETDPVGSSTDTTPPTAAITAPSSGATVSGTATVNSTASDNVGVAGVRFKVNGNNLGAEDTSSPYSTSWNTTTLSNGTYTLTATARDAAGNTTTSTPVTVTVSNAAPTPAAPTVSLTANPASIASGQSSSLTWSSSNATSCTASGGWTGTKTTSGTQSVSPTITTNYTLSCTGTGGTAQQTATVTVSSTPPPATPTVSLAANPATITSGQSSTLTWSSTNATSCTASGAWTGTKAVSGSQSVSPTTTSTYTLTCTGTGSTSQSSTITVGSTGSTTFFSEGYEDTNFAARGWYDITTGTVDTAEHHSGNASLRCTYNAGGTNCTAPKRHKFTESDSVYVSYWVKYSSNFVGSGVGYHPHEFLFLTNLNGDYDGLAFDYLTLYLESHWNSSSSGVMQVGFQDGQNIDQSRRGQNLIGVTENRAVAGCNGSPSGYEGSCYNRGDGVYVNGVLLGSSQTFTTANKNNWNHVEAYYQLNSISNGIGQANGIIRVWFNDSLVFERTNAILRTGQRSTMKLNQFIFGPWIGDGSPVTQTMWIDDLVVASARPGSGSALAAPTNLRIAP